MHNRFAFGIFLNVIVRIRLREINEVVKSNVDTKVKYKICGLILHFISCLIISKDMDVQ